MSIDLALLGSDLDSSQDEVKEMLSNIVTGLDDIFVAIEENIKNEDYDSLIELAGIVETQIAHFNLTKLETEAVTFRNAAIAKDQGATQVAFDNFKKYVEDIKSIL
ncbi:hypothetical protein MNB_SV-15-921 [hydrothermal vent metagenome]|uniref:Uncharacterized protein n=1 Tax=hydrothermal vent metagenome TaxID=652676 RepID=A0A1W1EKG8_9ZZZZ